jgi:hypothetical protein
MRATTVIITCDIPPLVTPLKLPNNFYRGILYEICLFLRGVFLLILPKVNALCGIYFTQILLNMMRD